MLLLVLRGTLWSAPPPDEELYTQLHLKNQPWASIPWVASTTHARRIAAESKKPIFLVVNTGNCLGFV